MLKKEVKMRTFRFAVVSLVMIFFLVLGIGVSGIYAGNYLGEYCWQIETDGKYIILRLAVTDMGNGHYFLNGRAINPKGDVIPLVGNGEIDGDKVYIVGTGARSWEFLTMTGTRSIILDLPTLNGSTEAIITKYDKETKEIWMEYKSGTLTFIPCPD